MLVGDDELHAILWACYSSAVLDFCSEEEAIK